MAALGVLQLAAGPSLDDVEPELGQRLFDCHGLSIAFRTRPASVDIAKMNAKTSPVFAYSEWAGRVRTFAMNAVDWNSFVSCVIVPSGAIWALRPDSASCTIHCR